jgi:hypothetical protein
MRVGDYYSDGSEVFFNYSPRSNCDLLRLYGFVLENNTIPIQVPVDVILKDVPYLEIKFEMLTRSGLNYLPYPYTDQSHFITRDGVSPKLVHTLAVKFYNLSEDEIDNISLIPQPDSLPFNKQQIKQELTKLVKEKLKKLTDVDEELTWRGRMALEVRNEEKKVLSDFMKYIPKLKL